MITILVRRLLVVSAVELSILKWTFIRLEQRWRQICHKKSWLLRITVIRVI